MKFYNNKKILITGNTGFKGSWLTLALKHFGSNIIGYSDKKPLNNSIINEKWIKKNIKQYYNKIENFSFLKKVIKRERPDIIFHLAAQPLVLESYKEPYKTFQTNIMGTINLLEAIINVDKKIPSIIITTDKVYSTNKNKKYSEDDLLGGIDPYSTSKVCAENISKSYSNLGLRVITARAGNIIGGGDWSKNRLIPDIINSIKRKEKPEIRNPLYTRPWLYVLDVIEGYLLLGKKLYQVKSKKYFNSYNLAPTYKKNYSVLDLTKELLKHSDNDQYICNSYKCEKENKFLSINPKKINEQLNWKANTTFNEAITYTAEWYLNENHPDTTEYSQQHIINYFHIYKKSKIKYLSKKDNKNIENYA